jgi:hypothetical protein
MSQQQETVVHFDQPCEHCILQIMKQAMELGKEFRYFSCADVQIVPGLIFQYLQDVTHFRKHIKKPKRNGGERSDKWVAAMSC